MNEVRPPYFCYRGRRDILDEARELAELQGISLTKWIDKSVRRQNQFFVNKELPNIRNFSHTNSGTENV